MKRLATEFAAPAAAGVRPDGDYFENCKSCGKLMMTVDYQIHLVKANPDWGASTASEIRNILTSVGVHALYEVNPGYCDHCSSISL